MNEKIKKEDIFSALDIEFVKRIYSTVVEEGSQTYEEQFADCTKVNEESEWRLYQELNESQKREYLNLIRMVIIDTIAEIFGILDGSNRVTERKKATLGKFFDCTVSINRRYVPRRKYRPKFYASICLLCEQPYHKSRP